MPTVVFLLKRFIAQRLLGLAIVVTLGFTIGLLVAGPVYADAAREAITSAAIRTAAVTVKDVRYSVYGSGTFDVATADREVSSATASLPFVSLIRQGLGEVRLVGQRGRPLSIGVLFRDGAVGHLPYRGKPPSRPGQVALPAAIARQLGVRPGDTLTALGPSGKETTLTLVGTFDRPTPDTANFWFGEQTPFPPSEGGHAGATPTGAIPPALMGRDAYLATIPGLDVTTQYVWDGYVNPGLTFERASALPAEIDRSARALAQQDQQLSSLHASTGLPTLIELVRQRVSNLRIPIFLVVFQIGAVTLAVLAGVGALVLTRQSFELAVLRSRGFSSGKLLAGQAMQAGLSALVAYPLGLVFGMALAALASHSNGPSLPGILFPIRLNAQAELLGLIAAIVGAAALLLLSIPHVRRTILEERRLLSREDRPLLARIPVEVFVLPLGIFAFLQLRNSSVRSSFDRGALDPLVLIAPTLLIFGLSFVALRLLLFALRRLDRRIGRSRRLAAYLAARRLGRSPGTSFATSLLLVLAVGLLVVSTSYRAIVIRNHEDSAHQQVGADWQVQIAASDQPLSELSRVPAGATPIVRTEPLFEHPGPWSLAPTAIGLEPATYARGGWWRSDYSGVAESGWLRDLQTRPIGEPVGAGELRVRLGASRAAAGLELLAVTEQNDGTLTTEHLGTVRSGTATYTAEIGDPGRLLSLSIFQSSPAGVSASIPLQIDSVDVDGSPISLAGWEALAWRGSGGSVKGDPQGDGLDVTVDPGSGHVVGGIGAPLPPLPALVSTGVASSQDEVFSVTLGGRRLQLRKAAVASAFPSVVGDFVVVPERGLLEATAEVPEPSLSPNEVWAMGADPRPALRRAGFNVGSAQGAAPIVAVLAQLPQSLAVGMNYAAAAGGLGLVEIGVAVGLYFAQRRREFEFAALRAMGTETGQIGRTVLLEQGLLIAFAIVGGGLLGYGILRLVMPEVGKTIGAPFPQPLLVLDWLSLGVSFAAIVIATAIGLAAAVRGLLRASVTSVLRGEAE
jgi:putative ABC transport system permease protein